MQIVIAKLLGLGMKLVTAAVIEKVVIILLERLVKSTKSTVDDELLEVVKEALSKLKNRDRPLWVVTILRYLKRRSFACTIRVW